MIVITGGAGFIGSAIACQLNRRGIDDLLIVDHLGESEKWKNLVPLRYLDYLDRGDFIERLEKNAFGGDIRAIFHLGACSATTERNADFLMENNYRYTARIARWQVGRRDCRFIYASSAATYGAGEHGYRDDAAALHHLRPLNMYGYSKHLFDLLARREGWLDHMAGLKYFNVYGPNEYHKGEMRSVVNKAYPGVRDEGRIRLFKSHRSDYGDGEQLRDFIYVADAVAMTLFFLDHPEVNGLFNIGTGTARSWNDVARALFSAAGKPLNIEYVPMPEALRGKYQYYTCADTSRLRDAGCAHVCMPLEEAIREYVRKYLAAGGHLEPDADRGISP
ncbi:ADP-glyceromanno-heptose 6-epimerase [Desulfococcus sp.]|uniref:ADP-glyceromanno-heptose 6-epimerase n=1 Tax=Desulfococcus sp. TaxID=2025834 RepID=UPI003593AE51